MGNFSYNYGNYGFTNIEKRICCKKKHPLALQCHSSYSTQIGRWAAQPLKYYTFHSSIIDEVELTFVLSHKIWMNQSRNSLVITAEFDPCNRLRKIIFYHGILNWITSGFLAGVFSPNLY